MDLQKNKEEIKRRLLELIERGSSLREEIEKDYRNKRAKGTFGQENDIIKWSRQSFEWVNKCITTVEALFSPSILVINRIKRPKMDGLYPSGENFKWAGIIKYMDVRLEVLDELYQLTNSIKEEELSDYLELNVGLEAGGTGFKIKIDKLLSKMFKK